MSWLSAGLFLFAIGMLAYGVTQACRDWPEHGFPAHEEQTLSESLSDLREFVHGVVDRHRLAAPLTYGVYALALSMLLSGMGALLKRSRGSRIEAGGLLLQFSLIVFLLQVRTANPDRTAELAVLGFVLWTALALGAGLLIKLSVHLGRAEARRLLDEGRRALASGDPSRAAECVEGSLALWPDNCESLLVLGDAHRASRHWEEALTALRTARSLLRIEGFNDASARAKAKAIKQVIQALEAAGGLAAGQWTSGKGDLPEGGMEREVELLAESPLNALFRRVADSTGADFFPGNPVKGIPVKMAGQHHGRTFIVSAGAEENSPTVRTTVQLSGRFAVGGSLAVRSVRLATGGGGSASQESPGLGFPRFFEVDRSAWTGPDVPSVPAFQRKMLQLDVLLCRGRILPAAAVRLFFTYRITIQADGVFLSSERGIREEDQLKAAIDLVFTTADLLAAPLPT